VASAYGGDKHKQLAAYDELGPGFFNALATEISKRIEMCKGSVPVITGKLLGNILKKLC
jgi:hypothetical protein